MRELGRKFKSSYRFSLPDEGAGSKNYQQLLRSFSLFCAIFCTGRDVFHFMRSAKGDEATVTDLISKFCWSNEK